MEPQLVVQIGKVKIGGPNFTVIAGPCSIESEQQFLSTATSVKASGAALLRGGIWKMRTSATAFQGLGSEACAMIRKIKDQTGMSLISEITDFRQVEQLFDVVDAYQIGARNMHNYSLLKELGLQSKPIVLKRGFSAYVDEWIKAAEYITMGGNPNVILCERGIRTFETANYSYGFWNSTSGMIGYTPEVLSSWNKNNSELTTMALAGTWKKNSKESAIDFSDKKIQAEHNFVIQDIQHQLNLFSLVSKSKTTVVELPYLYHLKTSFVYFCESIQRYMRAVHLLHPTAALGLFPRQIQAAQEFSHINIQEERKQFGAPLGFVSRNEGFMLVAIRNIMWSGDQIQLFAGCGVTGESLFEDEWQEILAKQDSVKKMLGVES